jgi:hypothetical protein
MQRLEVSGAVRHTHTHTYIYIYIYIYVIRRVKVKYSREVPEISLSDFNKIWILSTDFL